MDVDIADFKTKLEASRRFEAKADGATFHLRLLPEHTWTTTMERFPGPNGQVLFAAACRAVLDLALIGWEGVTTRHLLPDAEQEAPIPFSSDARAMLLDARQDIADEIMVKYGLKMKDRREKKEAARKNSSGASSGT